MLPTNKLTSVTRFLYTTDALSIGFCMILILGFVSLIKTARLILFNFVTKTIPRNELKSLRRVCH